MFCSYIWFYSSLWICQPYLFVFWFRRDVYCVILGFWTLNTDAKMWMHSCHNDKLYTTLKLEVIFGTHQVLLTLISFFIACFCYLQFRSVVGKLRSGGHLWPVKLVNLARQIGITNYFRCLTSYPKLSGYFFLFLGLFVFFLKFMCNFWVRPAFFWSFQQHLNAAFKFVFFSQGCYSIGVVELK